MMPGGVDGGITTSSSSSRGNHYFVKKMTWFVLQLGVICVLSGLMIGYEIGILGGVLLMPKILKTKLPEFVESTTSTRQYCTLNSENNIVSLYFSLFIFSVGLGSIFAFLKSPPRTVVFFGGAFFFLLGAVTSAFANRFDLYLLGVGFGWIIEGVPKYISETAHHKYRSALNGSFQMMITIGIFVAYLVNYGTNNIDNGWVMKVVLCVAAVPALIVTLGSLFLPGTPNSIFEEGEFEKAKYELRRMHGTNDVDNEFNKIMSDHESLKRVDSRTWLGNIRERKNRPYLMMAIVIPIFQQLTGISSIILYAPLLFKTIGFGTNASLKYAVITGGVNVAATLVATIFAIRPRRRFLHIGGGLLMFLCHIIVYKSGGLSSSGNAHILRNYGKIVIVVALICIYVLSFAWSLGPLGWLVPNSEIFPLEVRSAGERMTVTMNTLFALIVALFFNSMLCHFKFGLFYIFAFFALLLTIFTYLFVPETNDIPIEEMSKVWNQHWFWKRYVTNPSGDQNVNGGSQIDLENNPSQMSNNVTIA